MKILKNIGGLKKAINNISNIAFVPTMGCLHKGHISLITESKKKCNNILVSIYVNPKQFNKKSDYNHYPRNLKKDIKILKSLKIDYLFLPTTSQIYKKKLKKINLLKKHRILCAKYRKGHFEGVLEIMRRFISLIKPKYIFMGNKDYQQLYLINNYLLKKSKIKIYPCKIIRNKDNLPLSSRNNLLSKYDLKKASFISKYLINFKKNLKKINNVNKNLLSVKKLIQKKFDVKVEYLELRNKENLQKTLDKKKCKIFIAYYLKKVRLIDNF